MLINIDLEIENQGRKETIPAILDTGAEGFAFLDFEVASKMGIDTRSGENVPYYGVGGKIQYGKKMPIDQLAVKGAAGCAVRGDIEVTFGPLGSPSFLALVGEKFMQATGLQIDYSLESGKAKVSCRGGEGIFSTLQPFPKEILYLGVAAVAIVVVALLLK
jgi:hypothetical protein